MSARFGADAPLRHAQPVGGRLDHLGLRHRGQRLEVTVLHEVVGEVDAVLRRGGGEPRLVIRPAADTRRVERELAHRDEVPVHRRPSDGSFDGVTRSARQAETNHSTGDFAWEYWGRRMAGLRAIVLMSSEMSRLSKTLASDAGGFDVVEMKRNQRRCAMNFAFSGRETIQSLKVAESKT